MVSPRVAEVAAAKLAYRNHVKDHARLTRSPLAEAEVSAVADEIGYVTATPAPVVAGHLAEADLVATALPAVWSAHADGLVDAWRVRVIAAAARALTSPASIDRLDREATALAPVKTIGQLRSWLRAFIARIEPDRHASRSRREFAGRGVWIRPTDDANAHLEAMMSARDAEQIDAWLERTARAMGGEGDDRTLDQKRADLVADVLLGRRHLGPDPAEPGGSAGRGGGGGAVIGITVPVTSLAGLDDDPGITWGHQTPLPADLVRDLACEPGALFYRIFTDPAGGVLDITELGRFASRALADALVMRDQTCRVAHCNVLATRCDKDHQTPWPQGPTSGANLASLCRRHHRLKTLGRLNAALLTRTSTYTPPLN